MELATEPRESKLTLDEAIAQGLVDSEKCTVRDPISGKEMALEEAIKEGVIDAERSAVYDSGKGAIIPLSQALSSGGSMADFLKKRLFVIQNLNQSELRSIASFIDSEALSTSDTVVNHIHPIPEKIDSTIIDNIAISDCHERPYDSSRHSSILAFSTNQNILLSESQLHLLRYNSDESSDQIETGARHCPLSLSALGKLSGDLTSFSSSLPTSHFISHENSIRKSNVKLSDELSEIHDFSRVSKLNRSSSYEHSSRFKLPSFSCSNPSMEFDLMFTSNYVEPSQGHSSMTLNNTFSIESFDTVDRPSEALPLFVLNKITKQLLPITDAISLKFIDPCHVFLHVEVTRNPVTKISLSHAIEQNIIDLRRGLLFSPTGQILSLSFLNSRGLIESDGIEFVSSVKVASKCLASDISTQATMTRIDKVWERITGQLLAKNEIPVLASKYVTDLRLQSETLSAIENKLVTKIVFSLNDTANQAILDYCQDISNEFTNRKENILSLIHKVERFLARKYDDIGDEIENELSRLTCDLNRRTGQLHQEISSRLRLSMMIFDEFEQFNNRFNDCGQLQEKLESTIESFSRIDDLENLTRVIVDMKSMECEFGSYQNDIRVLNNSKLKLIDKINKFDENKRKFCGQVSATVTDKEESKVLSTITTNVDQIVDNHQKIYNAYKDRLLLLTNANDIKERLRQLQNQIDCSLNDMKTQIDFLEVEKIPTLVHANELYRVHGELSALSRTIKSIDDTKSQCPQILGKIGISQSTIDDMLASIDDTFRNYSTTMDRVNDLMKGANHETLSGHHVTASITNLGHWLADIDHRLAAIGPLSLDIRNLTEQDRLVHTLLAEISGRQPGIDTMSTIVDQQSKAKVDELKIKMDESLRSCSNTAADINQTRVTVDGFNALVSTNCDWMSSTIESLSDRMFVKLDEEKILEKLNEVKGVLNIKDKSVQEIQLIANTLLTKPNCRDQKYIENSMENVLKIRSSLDNLIKSRDEELHHRHEFGGKYNNLKTNLLEVVNGMEHVLTTIAPVAIDLVQLESQNVETKELLDNWESQKTVMIEFCEVGSEFDLILQGFPPGSGVTDHQYKITSPIRRSFKLRHSSSGIQAKDGHGTGPGHPRGAHNTLGSGSESSGVSSADYINLNQELNEVALEMDDIKNRFSEIGDRLSSRRTEMQKLISKCHSFENDYEECSNKLNSILSTLFPDDEVLENVNIDGVNESIRAIKPEFDRILSVGYDLLRSREYAPGSIEIKAKLKSIDRKYMSLVEAAKKQVDVKKNADDQKRKFLDLKRVLDSNIMRKERMMNVLGPVGTSVTYANSQLQQVNALRDEVEGIENDIKELSKVAEDILRSVSPTSSEASDIESTLCNFNRKISDLSDSLKQREADINAILGPSKDFYILISSIEDRLTVLRDGIDGSPISDDVFNNSNWAHVQIDLNSIKTELRDVDVLSRTLVNSTSDETAQYDIKNKVGNVTRQCREIQSKIDRNVNENDRRSVQEEEIIRKLEDAQVWLVENVDIASLLTVETKISPAVLLENMKQLKTLQGDIKHKKSQITDLNKEIYRIGLNKSPTLRTKHIHDTIANLLPQFDQMELAIDDACKEYQKASINSDRIVNDVRKIESWIDIEKQKLDRQYPVGVDVFESEERALEQTLECIGGRQQQLEELGKMMKSTDNVDSSLLLASHVDLICTVESRLFSLKDKTTERLDSIKECHEKISTVSDNLGDIDMNLSKLDLKWQNLLNDLSPTNDRSLDVAVLEKEVLDIQKELGQQENDLSTVKGIISSIVVSSHINAQLLEPVWRRSNDKCEGLRIDVAQKLNVLKSKQKAAEEYKVRLEIVTVRQKNLREKIDNFPQPCLDLDSLEDQIQDMSTMLREAHENDCSIENLRLNTVTLAAQGCLESADNLSQKCVNIKFANEEIVELIEDRQSSLRLQHSIVTDFECKKNDLSRKLEDVSNGMELTNLFAATRHSSKTAGEEVRKFVTQRLDPLKRELEQVVKVGNEACSTVMSGLGYKHIEQETEHVKHSYDKLMHAVSDIENNVDRNLINERNFESTVNNLSAFIANIRRDIMVEEPPSIEYHKSKSQLNTHRLLVERLRKRHSSLEELNRLGSDILVNVDDGQRQSVIRDQLTGLNSQYDTLMDIANEKSGRYEKAVKLSKAFKDLYEPSLAWLDSAERELENLDTSPTTDTSEIEKRMTAYQDLIRDLTAHQDILCDLDLVARDLIGCSSDSDAIMIKKRVETIRGYFDESRRNAETKFDLFKNSVPIAERFLLANNKLDLVLPSLTALVRDIDSTLTPLSERHFDIIENETNILEKIVVQARADLETLKTMDTFERSLEKVEDIFLENERCFREVQNEVVKKATLIGSNKTKAKHFEDNLQASGKYLDGFQLQMKELHDKIAGDSPDYEAIKVELLTLYPAWTAKKEEIHEIINDTRKHIRQTPGTDTKCLKSILNQVNQQFQTAAKNIDGVQLKLDELIPLFNEFNSNYVLLNDWFRDTDERISDNKINNFDPDQLYFAKEEIKNEIQRTLANVWEDQKPLLDKVIKTGRPLLQLLTVNQAKNITTKIDYLSQKYKDAKDFIRFRTTGIEELLQVNTQLNEKVDQCINQLDNVRDRVCDCYQPSVHPEKLEEELSTFDEILMDLDKLQEFIRALENSIGNCSISKEAPEDQHESVEVLQKLGTILNSSKDLQNDVVNYKDKISHLLEVANHFWIGMGSVDQKLTVLNTQISSFAPDSMDNNELDEKKEMINKMRKDIDDCERDFERLHASGCILVEKVGNPNELPDVEQIEDDIKRGLETVKENFEHQLASIDNQRLMIEKIETIRSELDNWFEVQNERLVSLGPLPTETRPVLSQIERTKDLIVDIEPRHRDIESINQLGYQLMKKSHPKIIKEVTGTLERINESWKHLLDSLGQRQHQLQCILLSLGEFHRAVDEFLEWINNTHGALANIRIDYGDVSGLELGLAQHKMIRANTNIQQASYTKIERKAAEIIKDDVNNLGHEAAERLATLNKHWESLKERLRSKHFELEDGLKESLIYYGDHQEVLRNIEDVTTKLNKFKFSGGLPDTAKEQLRRFMEIYNTLPKIEIKITRLHDDSSEITKKSSPAIKESIEKDVSTVDKKWSDITSQAETRKSRLEKSIDIVESFHSDMAKFINWLTMTENTLNQEKTVSRIVSIITDQMESHRLINRDITSHREELLSLDKVATHLKYLSQKHDIVLIRNLMSSIHHRWERVVSRSSERSRNLDYAYKEAKRFEDMNKVLLEIIDENIGIIEQDTIIGQSPEVIREQIVKHQEFQCRLGVHNLSYDETRRFGYQLRDKALGSDKTKIEDMVHHLQVKWQSLCSKSMERERTLNDALLLSGHYKDALDNLLTWLRNTEPNFKDATKDYAGDLNTVQILLTNHCNFEKEMKSREKMVEKIKRDANQLMMQSDEDTSLIEDQLSELYSLWSNINTMATTKKQNLEEARVQALEFEVQWNTLKDMFAKSENGLRYLAISPEEDNEEVITNMITNCKKFHRDLLMNEEKINSFQRLGHEILSHAHPDAEGPIKHYINIVKSQWSELLSWSEQRNRNLQDQLDRCQQRKVLLDDLLVWLATAEGTLVASEHRDLPCSATESTFQFEDHERFIMDMTLKQKDHDEIITNAKKKNHHSLPINEKNRRNVFGSNQNLNKEAAYQNPKINQLHSKWQKVWLMTMSRRKRLLDHNEHLKEVEKMKNFDFKEWRGRYMKWMSNSKSRVMDLFRRYDTDHDGRITRKEFIDGILESRFPTSRLEMDVVADIFDKEKTGFINYNQFIAALRPDRESYQAKESNESSAIDDEVKKQVSKCSCVNSYKITQSGEGKYKFGEDQKIRLVRVLRSTVMVRIGGGWSALDEFLQKHDPCRESIQTDIAPISKTKNNSKGRTNVDLREKLPLSKGSTTTLAATKLKPDTATASKKSAGTKHQSPKTPTSVASLRTPASTPGTGSTQQRSRVPTRESSRTSSRPPSPDKNPPR